MEFDFDRPSGLKGDVIFPKEIHIIFPMEMHHSHSLNKVRWRQVNHR